MYDSHNVWAERIRYLFNCYGIYELQEYDGFIYDLARKCEGASVKSNPNNIRYCWCFASPI